MADYNPAEHPHDPNAPRHGGPNNGPYKGGPNGIPAYGNGAGSYQPMPPQAQHSHAASTPGMDISADGLGHILARQWHVVVLTALAALMLSILYLMVTKPTYTSVATLKVAPLDPTLSQSSSAANNLQDDSDFLETECITIKSTQVIALAMDKIRDTKTLKSIPQPLEYVRAHLQADPSKVGRAIDVSFDSHYPDDADLIVSSVVQAYEDYEQESWTKEANKVVNVITQGSHSTETELINKIEQAQQIAAEKGFTSDTDPEKTPQHMTVLSLQDARDKAKLDSLRASTAYQQAAKAIIGHPDLVHAVDVQEQNPPASTSPEDQLKRYQDELAIEQAKLVDDQRNYGPSHPIVMTDQARVNAMIVSTVVAAKEWEESTQSSLETFEKSLQAAKADEAKISDDLRRYIELHEDIKRLRDQANTDADRSRSMVTLEKIGALKIDVINPAVIQADPKPSKLRTLAIGSVLGLIAGLGFACVRDWTDDRMRTPQAVRATIGAPILGAIPSITTAYTAADRGQIVHHEPFGIASESYRTLRTALQFGLPAGTKTLLITSPVSGDGKSTFVSNLGIALAQASKRVLIIDADFRAPMQHRLFGLRDRVGFASVLNGVDTIEAAIQHTEIAGLDVLPCGPTPTNPSEMLNSPAFSEHLNELADKYDIVLLDSPPVTAVADARILAASSDVSLMVIRLESSTRKQAEAARDGLRSVGARLIGVAVNGVTRAAHFGGASGYYNPGSHVTAGFDRPPVRRPGYDENQPIPGSSPRV